MRGAHQVLRLGGISGPLALALISGCSGKDCCEPPPTLSIRIAQNNNGDQQTGTVGATLAKPVRVFVSFVLGDRLYPAAGVTVRWTSQGDTLGFGGSVSPSSSTTDGSGIAAATWTLGHVAGPQYAYASISGASQDSAVTFTASANPGPASQLRFAVNPTNTFSGYTIKPAVQVWVIDVFGNQIDSPITVRIGLAAHAGSAALSGTTSVTAIGGVATFSDLSVDQPGAGNTLTATVAAVPPVASTAFEIVTPGSGQIAFTSWRDGNAEIYVMGADGSGQVNLSQNPFSDDAAVWSPDGLKLAFSSNRDGKFHIYMMTSDGSGVTRLTTDTASDYMPVWSPDGSQIAFGSNRDGKDQIYVMNADGSGVRRLTTDTVADDAPAWSPDGSKIAFQSARDGNAEVYVMAADGSNPVNLSNNPAGDFAPTWSPDGSKIAFTSSRDGHPEVYVMNADGSAVSRLTTGAYPDVSPVWSPDGTTIAFVLETMSPQRRCGTGRGRQCYVVNVITPRDLYTVHADGSAVLNLTNYSSAGLLNSSAAWSPDGSRIALASSRNGNAEIYVMYPDGSGVVNLTSNPSVDLSPVWKPR